MGSLFGISRQACSQLLKAYKNSENHDDRIVELVLTIRKRMPRIGGLKLHFLLKDNFQSEGIKCGRDKLYLLLKRRRLLVPRRKRFFRTTDSNHRFNRHSNKIKGITIKRPEQVWQSDITYVRTKNGMKYLNLITDCYSKKIMGHFLSDNLKAASTKIALIKALNNRSYPKRKLIHHSDRGFQYCSPEYTEHLEMNKIKISMTTKYDPYENSIAERVNGILKQEFFISDARMTKSEIQKIVDQSIYIYNNERPHLSCEMMTPCQAHNKGKFKYKQWGKYSITDQWN